MGVAMVAKHEEFAVMLVVRYLASCATGRFVRSSPGVKREQLGAPLGSIHSKQDVYDTTLKLISNKICRKFRQMGRGRRSKRDHNLSFFSGEHGR